MTAAIPSSMPASLIAGDTWQWTRTFGDYPAGTWTAVVYFENSTASFNASATASGTDFLFTIDAATTAAKKAGRYKWWVRVTSGSTVTTVEDGWLDVQPDPAANGQRDHRSDARKLLDAVEATLYGRATDGQLAMAINGRSISRIPLPELRQWRDQLKQEVATQEKGERAGLSRNLKVRLTRV